MTSKEVEAYLRSVGLGKAHSQILGYVREIKDVLSNLGQRSSALTPEAVEGTYTDSQGKIQPMYIMNVDFVALLVPGKSVPMRIAMLNKAKALRNLQAQL